jgi:hypothetical protein
MEEAGARLETVRASRAPDVEACRPTQYWIAWRLPGLAEEGVGVRRLSERLRVCNGRIKEVASILNFQWAKMGL